MMLVSIKSVSHFKLHLIRRDHKPNSRVLITGERFLVVVISMSLQYLFYIVKVNIFRLKMLEVQQFQA